jgi:nitroreductase
MTTRVIPVGHLDEEQVRSVLSAAMAAPSLHNSQPWRFHCTTATIELHADTRRAVSAADPEHRELALSCGAALLNLRLAIRASGVHPAVQLLPDPHRPDLLAVIRPQGHTLVRPDDRELAAAILRRRTDHGPFHPTVVPASVVTGLRLAARTEQAWLPTLTAAHLPILRVLVEQAHGAQRHDPAVVAELSRWRDRGVDQAYPSVSSGDIAGDPLVVVVGTFLDVPLARLQAGQAMQRVLLAATAAGLSASFLSEVVAVTATRRQLRDLVVGGLWPQAVLRLGHSSAGPASPRRDLEDVVTSGPMNV